LGTLESRILKILLFPIIALIFIVGWILYVVGDKQTSNNSADERKIRSVVSEDNSTSIEDYTDLGILEEVVEEQLADQ
jgi:hypothetical protein